MRIGVLTSSRADYSIYLPLLKEMVKERLDIGIIAFGTHLSTQYGHTVDKIRQDGFPIVCEVDTMPAGDAAADIAAAMGKTINAFAKIWEKECFDLLIALGDRYEMFAACASAIPFNIPIAHIHGGEKTEGAIDDAFRHSITQMSDIHFTAAEPYRQRVVELKGSGRNVYNTGALSIDNLTHLTLYDTRQFYEQFGIDLTLPSILITLHPETVDFEKNRIYVNELVTALAKIKNYQFIITMPNADTMGNMIRQTIVDFAASEPRTKLVESFGTIGYLTCMKYCSMMLGNTSSGFIEAAYFPKYVINLGERQRGRINTPNINTIPIDSERIVEAVEAYTAAALPDSIDIYGDGTAAAKMVAVIKSMIK